jgi:amino acid adenylation domain-containing protein
MSDFNPAPHETDLMPKVPVETAGVVGNRDADRALTYWRKQLAGIPAILELPTDRSRPPVRSFRADRETIEFPQSLVANLQRLCAEQGVSLPIVLLAAYHVLLMRHTRQEDIVVGTTLRESDADSATSIPIRSDFSDDPSFRKLLTRVGQTVRSAQEHQEVLWERLVEAVQPEQDASRHPIFQASFLFTAAEGGSIFDEQRACQKPAALDVDLNLQLRQFSDNLAAEFLYATDLFDAGTIRRMAGHFQQMLDGIISNPEEGVWRLPILTAAERQQLVVDWNNTRGEYPREACVPQLFEAQADRTPEALAVVFENAHLTYRELNARANQLAHHLVKLGVGPKTLVGICVERSLEMVVGLLAILKAGGAYVPVDPAFPADRIAFMLEDAEAPVLLTQQRLAGNLPKHKTTLVRLDSDWATIVSESAENLPERCTAEDLAYTIYTSGSTGKPKGVQILHRGVVNFLMSMAEKPGMTQGDRLLAVTTLSFDIAGLEIYLPLILGASVEIVSRNVYSDGNRLLAKLKSSGATVMQATPATWRMLLEAGWKSSRGLKILVGGEAVPARLAEELIERADSVWNMYGPTETTIWSTVRRFEPGERTVSIGRPISNTEIFILDKLLQPAPIGVAGELLIGGDGLARGYFKRGELTAEKFIPHPFSDEPTARLYRTGDLARYLPNGEVEFLGRIDHQVKIRGFRIELGEIEAVLRQHPGINETVVVAREDVPGDKHVVAYWVAKSNRAPSTSELRRFLKEKLPVYMVPSSFVRLQRMPLTPNGKVDRRALPAASAADLAPSEAVAEPKDEVEKQIVHIWENVLNTRPIGVRDNFFDLGGHSILAVRLMNRVAETFGNELPIAVLLQAPTIEQLASIVRQKESMPAWSCLVPIQTAGSKRPFFCIHGANGAVVRFRELSKYLGPDHPFYGLQANGLGTGNPVHARTEEMAALYIEEIRKVQPQGPYSLGGYSFGGAIAFEMAQQLAAQGENESTVVLFDTIFAFRNLDGSSSDGATSLSTSSALLNLFSVPASQRWPYFWRMMTAPGRAIERKLHVAKLPTIVKKVRAACFEAERNYRPQPYAGRVILFRSNHKPLGQVGDPRAGWKTVARRGLEIYEIDGNHENILLEPQVRQVAQLLKPCLESDVAAREPDLAGSLA